MKRWLYPTGTERDYLAALRRYVLAPFEQSVRDHLMPALPIVFAQARGRQDATDPRDIPEGAGWFETLREALVVTLTQAGISDGTIREIVMRVAASVETFNAKEFHAVLRSVYRVDIFPSMPSGMRLAIESFEMQNIALIKSIPVEATGRMSGKIIEALRTGRTLKDTQALVREELGVADRRARVIARDQVGKLNGQITELRQTDIGVDSYKWRGILDARERESHVAREGKVFKWSEPPDDGHPGEPIQCRCSAEPELPSWEEMERRFTGVRPPAGTYS